MANVENPLVPIEAKVARIHARLLEFMRNVLVKIRPVMGALQGFLANLRKSAKELALTVGKSAVDGALKMGAKLLQIVAFVQKQTVDAIKLATKVRAVIRKAIASALPAKLYKAIKAMVARLARVFRTIVTKVFEVLVTLNPIDMALRLIDTMRMMLQMVFKWVAQVGPVASGVKKAKALIRKTAKLLKSEAKMVTELVKQANKLKPA